MIMKYILVRHTETRGNVERRFNGRTESPFTPRGLRMNEILVEELAAIHGKQPVQKVYASPISRARIIGEAAAEKIGCPLVIDDGLREFDFGIFDGLTAEEAMEKDAKTWNLWMADYNFTTIPGGENYNEYHRRIGQFLEIQQQADEDGTVAIVAHGGTVQSLLVNLLNLPLDSKWHFQIPLGGIVMIDCPEGYGILKKLYAPDYD